MHLKLRFDGCHPCSGTQNSTAMASGRLRVRMCRFLYNLGPGMGELNNRLVQKGVPPELQKVDQIEAIVQQATQTAGRPAWAMDDWLS